MTGSHFPCACKIISTTSRTAPRPPAARVDEIRRRLHLRPRVGHRHAEARAWPAAPNPPRRRRQNKPRPNSIFSRASSFSTAPVLLNLSPCWTRKSIFNSFARIWVAADGRAETQPTFKPARRASTRPRPSRMLNRLTSRSPPMNTEPSVSTPSTSHRNSLMRREPRGERCGKILAGHGN